MRLAKKHLTIKPRLLIILNRFVIGGQAVDTIPLAAKLLVDFDILILYGEKEKDEIEPSFLLKQHPGIDLKKIKYLKRSVNPLIDVLAFFSLLRVLLFFKPNIVHTHGAKSGVIGRLSAWVAGVPVIIHTFHGHFFHSYFSKKITTSIIFIERIISSITTSAIALSEAQKTELVDQYKIVKADKIKIINLGFAFNWEQEDHILRSNFRKKYGLQETDVAVGIVGRIVAIKNHSFFIKVIQQLLAQPSTRPMAFFIIGDGDLKNELQNKLMQKNIRFNNTHISDNNRVVFTSWITEMPAVMNGLDIVALTSLNEGTPLSIIEAEFFKRPVVSTNVGGVKDTLIDGKTGLLSESYDVTTFAANLRLLIDDADLRKQMGEEGYKYASTKFSKQREVDETRQFYYQLLQKKGFSFT